MLDQRIDDGLSILSCDLYQHHIACLPLNKRGDLAVMAAKHKITFPVAWHSSIFRRGWTLAN